MSRTNFRGVGRCFCKASKRVGDSPTFAILRVRVILCERDGSDEAFVYICTVM